MSSRFFSTAYSDSDSSEEELITTEEELLSSSEEDVPQAQEEEEEEEESSDEEDLEDEEEEEQKEKETDKGMAFRTTTSSRTAAYFLRGSNIPDSSDESESESDDDTKKVVKSAKDKLLEEMKSSVESIDNASDFDDWITVSKEFDKLNKLLTKSQQQNISTPKFYIKTLAELENIIVLVSKENTKMNAVTSKAFNSIKQRVKKSSREFEDLIQQYNEDPDAFIAGEGLDESIVKIAASEAENEEEQEDIPTTLKSIIESRGKKNVDRYEQVSSLEKLLAIAETPFEFICVYLLLIPSRFDLTSSANVMPVDHWNASMENMQELLTILEENFSKYRVTETAEPGFDFQVEPKPNSSGVVEILGSVASFVDRLDDELNKHLLSIPGSDSTAYRSRLRDEIPMYNLIVRCQLYLEALTNSSIVDDDNDQLFRVIIMRINHIYYRSVKLIISSEKAALKSLPSSCIKSSIIITPENAESIDVAYTEKLFNNLSSILYRQSNSVYRKKAMLYHVYYFALNGHYYKARDMLLMSHLQSSIHTSEIALQVLFNRTLTQLGLAAFKLGLIEDTLRILNDLFDSGKIRDLVGQTIKISYNNNNAVNLSEKQKMVPYHMHINLQLIEAVFLTCSLLTGVPLSVSNNANNKRNSVRSFKRNWESFEKQTFTGPAENTKDFVFQSADALVAGEWKKAYELINCITAWKYLYTDKDHILKNMLKETFQLQGLKTYVLVFKSYYQKLSIPKLASVFELSKTKTVSVLANMIYNEEINAYLDQLSNSVYFIHETEKTKTQELALGLTEKIALLAERNERLTAGGQQQHHQLNHHHHRNNNNNRRKHSLNFKISNSSGIIAGALNGMGKSRN